MKYQQALVTGASRGLGAALARSLASRGCALVLVARSAEQLLPMAESLREKYGVSVETSPCDLSNAKERALLCDSLARRDAAIDVLINNAGAGSYRGFLEESADDAAQVIELNVTAPILLAKACLPRMMAAKRGYIVNIASDLSRRPLANMATYVASKHALLGFSHSLLREAKAHQVKVTCVLPGIIDSAFNGAIEGSKEEHWALQPAQLSEQITALLDTPQHLIVDELAIHPMQQDF